MGNAALNGDASGKYQVETKLDLYRTIKSGLEEVHAKVRPHLHHFL